MKKLSLVLLVSLVSVNGWTNPPRETELQRELRKSIERIEEKVRLQKLGRSQGLRRSMIIESQKEYIKNEIERAKDRKLTVVDLARWNRDQLLVEIFGGSVHNRVRAEKALDVVLIAMEESVNLYAELSREQIREIGMDLYPYVHQAYRGILQREGANKRPTQTQGIR